MKNANNKGITLVELIVSFALIGVAIIYFFQTLYTVKKVYANARNETNNYLNVNYDLRILDEHYDLREKEYSNICKKYNLSCKKVEFAGYFSDEDLSDETAGEDGNDKVKKAIKEGTMKGYKLKVIYSNGKFYYLYKTFKKLNNDGTALMLPYFPGSFGTITGNQNGKYSSRRRVIEAKGVGTVANYSFFKEYETNSIEKGAGVVFSLSTNCSNAINKTTFIYGDFKAEIKYEGNNWNDADIYENYLNVAKSNKNLSYVSKQKVDLDNYKINNEPYDIKSYLNKYKFKYYINNKEIEEKEANNNFGFYLGKDTARLAIVILPKEKKYDKFMVEVEMLSNGNSLDQSCSAYTSLGQFSNFIFEQ